MATQVQFRRGNTASMSTFTGANGEITVDTDKHAVVVHDGITVGGWPTISQSSPIFVGTLSIGTSSLNSTALAIGSNPIANSTGANNAFYLGGILASGYQTTTGLNANIASYLPNYTGTVNAASFNTGAIGTGTGGTVQNTSVIFIGNNTINTTITATNITIDDTIAGVGFLANTTGLYAGVVNGSSITVGTSTIANSTGVYTGVVNGSSITVGTSTIANSTGVYTGVVNGSSITVGTSWVANSTGGYHTGTINAASHTVGTSTIANSSGVYAAVINASSGVYGTVQTATQGTIDHNTLSNYVANKHIDHTTVSISAGNGLSGGGDISTTRTVSVLANSGVVANSTGTFVNAQTPLVANATGLYLSTSAGNGTFSSGISAITVDSYGRVTSVTGSAGYSTTTGTVTSIANGVGIAGGTITSSGTLSLATTGAGAASYTSGISAITVDAYGRVTSVTGSAGYTTGSGYALLSGNQTFTGGFSITSYNLGTGSGTVTPAPANGNYQYITNNGAFTIAAPASDCAIDILLTNGVSASTITFSGYTVPSGGGGDTYATTNANRYLLMIRRINSISTYVWKALQ